MDDSAFDRITKVLGVAPTRRTALGLAAGAAIGGLARLFAAPELESEAKGKKKGKGKKKKKQTPRGEQCGRVTCRLNESCCGGRCVDPFFCCNTTENCNGCQACVDGLCEVDPSRNGAKCADCLLCADGACEVPENEFCQDHQLCRPENGRCCEKCLDDQCCAIGEVCIKPGASGSNSCCNTAQNEPCGLNGDGTYRECCVSGVEECVQGTCELRIPCPSGRRSRQGLCCAGGEAPCWGPEGPFCPPPGGSCCGAASCDATQRCCDETRSLCCPIGQCAAGQCCTGDLKGCNGECVDTRTDKRHCGRCGFDCIAPGFDCCSGSCTNLMSDEENCGACGNACNPRSEVCREGECREICSLNQPPWQNPCDDGVDHWCCPDGSTQCCRLSGNPHCC